VARARADELCRWLDTEFMHEVNHPLPVSEVEIAERVRRTSLPPHLLGVATASIIQCVSVWPVVSRRAGIETTDMDAMWAWLSPLLDQHVMIDIADEFGFTRRPKA